jgi:DNA-binding NtrC family response regulator
LNPRFFILEEKVRPPHPGWEFVGASAPVHALYDLIRSFACWDKDPVLIYGETGTGKEMVARRLHEIRKKGHFRPYNASEEGFSTIEEILKESRAYTFRH